jgi:hypothetical protein
MTGVMVTIPHAFHGRGECPDAGMSSHTIRSVQLQERARLKNSFLYRLARLTKTVVFLPAALHRETLYWLLGISVPKML